MSIKTFKYLSPITLYLTAWASFQFKGWVVWLPLLYVWVLIPLLELVLRPDKSNMSAAEEEISKKSNWYDYMLYIIVPLQYAALIYFLFSMKQNDLTGWEIAGRISAMGLLCGTFGINVAHELGHRNNRFEQFLAKTLLATSLYIHFFIEHNKGHHKNVATHEDPSSARMNEPVYTFYFRTIIFSYISAWKIANNDCRKKNVSVFGLQNEMIQAHIWQLLLVNIIYFLFGGFATISFLSAALIGILLLETVNYIEHYGLTRKKTDSGNYERAMPHHSWNSNHPIGRVMLFELSRHSDHHYLASKKYQILKHHDNAPQLPTGYPGSMILSLLPPLWFYVMNKRIKALAT
ncbi:MAG: alkane 1-monooxygenase [Ferruginibacter sp.]|nr:alkane 1-monooxygenase [Ferruginibacter sp.]